MQYVALLRGVNVGGGNKVRMSDLRALAADIGLRDPRSYLASGNLVFDADGAADVLSRTLRQAMAERMGVDVPVLVCEAQQIRQSLQNCPYQPEDPRHVHVAYLLEAAAPDWSLYDTHKAAGDGLTIDGALAWLHTPGGYGRSKLAERLPRVLGADFTARNLRTVAALCEMLDADAGA